MWILAFVVGFFLGFVTAIPVSGPITALILSLGMKSKMAQARWTACGAAVVEGIYAFVAFWGFTQLFAKYQKFFLFLNLVVAVVVGGLGIYFFYSQKMRKITSTGKNFGVSSAIKSFVLGLGVAMMNPMVIATWAVVIATLNAMNLFNFSTDNAFLFASGVSTGIFSWFFIFLKLIERHREKFQQNMIDRILKGVGVVLFGISIAILVRTLNHSLI